MAYYDHDSRYHNRPRHESSYSRSRDTDAYSRRPQYSNSAAEERAAMRDSVNQSSSYSSPYKHSYDTRYAAPPPPKRSSAQPYRSAAGNNRWPPSPSVEDETASLAKEFPSSAGLSGGEDDRGEASARGSVDQYPIIEEIEQPRVAHDNDERRFVLVSDPRADEGSNSTAGAPTIRDRRRKSFAERGNMAYLKTDVEDPPVFTERKSTPYAYTKPQKESLTPSASDYFLSPEPITPSSSSVPRSVPNREGWDARDQNAKPTRQVPIHSRYDSFTQSQSPRASKHDVFEDSDGDSDNTHLRTERKPARYSFVKSDLQKEDLRTNLVDKSDRRKPSSGPPPQTSTRESYTGSSSGSSKYPTPRSESPRSSTSSLNGGTRQKPRPTTVDPDYGKSSRYPASRPASRPSSPLDRDAPSRSSPPRSPRLPPRRPASPSISRPDSSSGARPPSPLSFSATPSSGRPPVTGVDWHATYPPTTTDRTRPASRHGRYETMPVPMPRIDVQSPSPARPPKPGNPLPYPVDDRPVDAFMPPEEQFQFDHSRTPTSASPRQTYPESPIPSSPSAFRPTSGRHTTNPEEVPRLSRVRSNSTRSQSSQDGRRERRTANGGLSLDKPLPPCPRSEPSARHTDWYTLENCPNFDLCPGCFDGVFADTPFSRYFSQGARRYEPPTERYCDFSTPWMRLAWLLTIKQRRSSPDLLYALATISETSPRGCPGHHELDTNQMVWFGIPDQRDGIHVTNFAICQCDMKMTEALFPSVKGYFTRILSPGPYGLPPKYTCSLRTGSRRFPKYLDLLVELDAEAQLLGQRPNIGRFVQLARENAFKAECCRSRTLFHKPWHFIPSLPEFTVCQDCFEELIWPAITSPSSSSSPSTIPKLFNRTIQLVPNEDPEFGSSCCLYSSRMRKVWERAVQEEDFGFLRRKALERKRAEARLGRERKDIMMWMTGLEKGGALWERAKNELKGNESEWKEVWE